MRTITLKNRELIAAYTTLVRLGDCAGMDPATALKIARNKIALEADIKVRDEAVTKILDEETVKDKEGNPVKDEDGNRVLINPDRFNARANEISELDVEVTIRPMKWDEISKALPTPNQIAALMPFIEDLDSVD